MVSEDLKQAADFFSGGEIQNIEGRRKWEELSDKIENSPFTADEFLYYCIEVHTGGRMRGILLQPPRLCSERVWDGFYQYKRDLRENLPSRVFGFYDIYRNFKETGGPYVLLNDSNISIPAHIKCEIALNDPDVDEDLYRRIMEENENTAEYILRGVPELRDYVPSTVSYLKI